LLSPGLPPRARTGSQAVVRPVLVWSAYEATFGIQLKSSLLASRGRMRVMGDDLEQVLTGVGPRLRLLRQQRGATLAALAETTGISVSTLSRLESGRRRPNLELLLPLARAYGVPLDDLVGAPPTGDPRIHLRPFTYHGRIVLPLTRRPGGLQAFKMIHPAGPSPVTPELKVHEGYEWMYVLNGKLRLLLGDQDLILSPGEAAEFDCHVPHWFGSGDGEAVEFLALFGGQGGRAHLRVRPSGRRSAS
jgi:transcriptional regulator with XRE-family HTH domain